MTTEYSIKLIIMILTILVLVIFIVSIIENIFIHVAFSFLHIPFLRISSQQFINGQMSRGFSDYRMAWPYFSSKGLC